MKRKKQREKMDHNLNGCGQWEKNGVGKPDFEGLLNSKRRPKSEPEKKNTKLSVPSAKGKRRGQREKTL